MGSLRAANDPAYRDAIRRQVEKLLRGTPYHSLQLPDGTIVPGMIGIEALEQRVASFPIPQDLHGRRVLDVGAASGWNSFEMVRRGAMVTAVDCVAFEEFSGTRELFEPPPEYLLLDVDELSPEKIGTFDYVLFFGVLYHLRHPLLSLEKICTLTRETAFVESFVSDPADAPSEQCSLEFYETDELGGQIDNWFGPTAKCLAALCRSAGFVRVKLEYIQNRRAGMTCHRRWEAAPENPQNAPVWLCSAVNNRTHDIYFHPQKDEYLCLYFRSDEAEFQAEQMRIEVDGFGAHALTVARSKDDIWQVNGRLPPGLGFGPHTVRLRTTSTRFANEFEIEMVEQNPAVTRLRAEDLPAEELAPPEMGSATNSLDGSSIFHGYPAERICCRFHGGEERLKRDLVFARFDDDRQPQPVAFLTDLGRAEWQANLVLPEGLRAGTHTVRLRTSRSQWSAPAEFTFQP